MEEYYKIIKDNCLTFSKRKTKNSYNSIQHCENN